jgi:hypothetical protein
VTNRPVRRRGRPPPSRLEQPVAFDQFLELVAARERSPSACAFFTKGSEKCSFNQRWLDLLRVAMRRVFSEIRGLRVKAVDATRGPQDRHDTLRSRVHLPAHADRPDQRPDPFSSWSGARLKAMLQVGGKGISAALVDEVASRWNTTNWSR